MQYSYKCRFVEVVDGDTLLLYIDLGFYIWTMAAVRITGIDMPDQPTKADLKREEQACKFMTQCFTDSDFGVIETHQDEEGQITADVIHEGKTINHELERRGLLRGCQKLKGIAH